ncbi:hypothetical protein WL08_15195 [Burkholderia ubonensis]|nr:hypothetical protein WL08_15195 [Burkholderia ubonensis]
MLLHAGVHDKPREPAISQAPGQGVNAHIGPTVEPFQSCGLCAGGARAIAARIIGVTARRRQMLGEAQRASFRYRA